MKVLLVLVLTFLAVVDLSDAIRLRRPRCKIRFRCKKRHGKRDDMQTLKRDIHDGVVESLAEENKHEIVREVDDQLNKADSVDEIRRYFLDEF